MSTPFLNRDAIFRTKNDLKTKSVEAFGGTVLIRQMNAAAGAVFAKHISADPFNSLVLWVIASVIDPDTMELMYTEADLEALGGLKAQELRKIAEAAAELNKVDLEETAKNSAASPNSDSVTA